MQIVLIIVGLFVLLKSGILSSFGLGTGGGIGVGGTPSPGYTVGPQPLSQLDSATAFTGASKTVSGTTSAISNQLASNPDTAGGALATAVPIIGAAFQAIVGIFQAQSAQRAKQATTENAAVAQAVPDWDNRTAQIVSAYNSGSITENQAEQLIAASWAAFWNAVTGVIQPGRNGCQSGAVTQPAGVSFCGGSYGAACCVGYDDLKNSNVNMVYALKQTDQTGKPMPAYILPVFASKYGGINRGGYTVTFVRP